MYSLLIIVVAINFVTLAKMFVKEFRPFLMDQNIKSLNCECSFGMPSGHAATGTIGTLVMLHTLASFRKQRLDEELDQENVNNGEFQSISAENSIDKIKIPKSGKKQSKDTKNKSITQAIGQIKLETVDDYTIQNNDYILENTLTEKIIAGIIMLGVGISRVYFGVHSISQVIIGASCAWLTFEIMQIFRFPIVQNLKNLKLSGQSTSALLLRSITWTSLGCLICFLLIYFLSRTENVEIPEKYQINMNKCVKCVNYYQYTLKGLVFVYVIPACYLIMSVLSILGSHRLAKDIDMEKWVLRKLIFIMCIFGSFLGGFVVRKLLVELTNVFFQFLVMIVIMATISIIFLGPTFIFRKINCDYEFDYIQLLKSEEQTQEHRLQSESNLSITDKKMEYERRKVDDDDDVDFDGIDPYRLSSIQEVSESREFSRQQTQIEDRNSTLSSTKSLKTRESVIDKDRSETLNFIEEVQEEEIDSPTFKPKRDPDDYKDFRI